MQYLLMIYASEAGMPNVPPAKLEGMSKDYEVFTKSIVASGNMRGGERLQPSRSATTVRMKDGKVVLTDGPFAETKEQLGGFYLIEAKNLDEATGIAKRIPVVAQGGCVEVRPIVPMNQ